MSTGKKETLKWIVQLIASVILTALGATSCMGHGPITF